MTIVFESAFASFQSASARSIATNVGNCTTTSCTVTQLDACFEAVNGLTSAIQALTSQIVSAADGVREPIVICIILAVVRETNEWSG